nr:MAG TPA: hypothetical protein [Crassvirales sp.]
MKVRIVSRPVPRVWYNLESYSSAFCTNFKFFHKNVLRFEEKGSVVKRAPFIIVKHGRF